MTLTGLDTTRAGLPRPMLTATRLKVTITLNAAEVLAVPAPGGKPRLTLRVGLPDRFVTAEIAAKSLRKAQAAIREAGADNIALVLQGRLTARDVITEAGLSAQPKAAKIKASPMMRTSAGVTMGRAFGSSDERVRSTRRRYTETRPIMARKA